MKLSIDGSLLSLTGGAPNGVEIEQVSPFYVELVGDSSGSVYIGMRCKVQVTYTNFQVRNTLANLIAWWLFVR